jgi:hypothetical protein
VKPLFRVKPLWWVLLGAGIAALVFGAVFVLTQKREKPQEIAKQVAREWTSHQVDSISDAIARQVTGGIPGLQQLASGVISSQIRNRIEWEYATPIRLGENTYEVVATASAPIEVRLLILDKRYRVSLGFKVVANTKDRTVERWSPDLGSFRFREN